MKRGGSYRSRRKRSSGNDASNYSSVLSFKFFLLKFDCILPRHASVIGLALTGVILPTALATEPPPPLLLTEAPVTAADALTAPGSPEGRYPAGSRVAIVQSPFDSKSVRVLSKGLYAAGSPLVSYDGEHVLFAGKSRPDAAWQIYEIPADGGRRRVLTQMPGGATSPGMLPNGDVIFVSPVPEAHASTPGELVAQIYALGPGGKPRQFTFGAGSANDPTLLADGRILFVSSQPKQGSMTSYSQALYTINNDGTEVSAFACQHQALGLIERPRQVAPGRVTFLALGLEPGRSEFRAETVAMARPFQSRSEMFPGAVVSSVEGSAAGGLLVCERLSSGSNASWSVFRVNGTNANQRELVFSDPSWNVIEAIEVRSSGRPMGRLSNVDFSKSTGQILCLDINDSTYKGADSGEVPLASKVRVSARLGGGDLRVLGEIPVQTDGSLMAEVPADVPLGFEALDDHGTILRRVAPFVWVRPGENRSCVGCHAEHNRAPHNHRPVAVRCAVPKLGLDAAPPKAPVVTAK